MSVSPASQAILERYTSTRDNMIGADLPWLSEAREKAAEQFGNTGFPTTRVEEWKYTSLKSLEGFDLTSEPTALSGDAVVPEALAEGARLVFVDGAYRADLSTSADVKGLKFQSLAEALADSPETLKAQLSDFGQKEPLLVLNGAFMEDGYVIQVDAGVDSGAPIEVIYIDGGGETATARQPRNVIVAGENSRVMLIERHVGNGPSRQFFNAATLVSVAAGAIVSHRRIQTQGSGSVHVNTVRVRIEDTGCYDSFILAQGGEVARDEVQVYLAAPGAEAKLNGIYLGSGSQIIDNTTEMHHDTKGSASHQLYKGALTEKARAVFQGNIRVEPGADGTDGQMTNKTLLLSDEAEIDTKPQLEIFADDVKCAHGATAGELDEEALFYLRSRGIPKEQARGILVEAFIDDVIDQIEDEPISENLRAMVANWLRNVQEKSDA